MAIEVTGDNGTLIASQVQSLLIEPLTQASTFLAAGPTVLQSNSPIRVPRESSVISAAFLGEGAEITDSGVAYDEVTLLPSTLKSLKVIVRLSNELIRTSVIGLEQVVRNRIVNDVARALDAALWDGAGTSNTIKGIAQATGIATGTLDLTDADSLIDGLATAQGNFVTPTHWVMTPASWAALRKLKVAEAGTLSDQDYRQYLFDPTAGLGSATPLQLFGIPVIVTAHIPNVTSKARVALVDFSKVLVARDVDAEVKVLDQTWGNYDSVGIRVVSRWDTALSQPKAVTLLTEA